MSRIEPPWPLNELARIDKLKGYGVLDTPPEPVFDRLTRLASRHFDAPIALVNLVDETRQWCKARFGLVPESIERRISFCAFTILEDQVLVIPDTTRDERFADNELVAGPPHLRFYAGAPLKTPDGLLIGTFCIIDMKPRPEFDEESRNDLEEFARLAMHQLEVRAAELATSEAEQRLREKHALLESIIESASDPIFAKDRDRRFTLVNSATARLFGRSRDEVVGQCDHDLFPPEDAARLDALCQRVVESGREETVEEELPFPDGNGNRVLMIAVMPLRDAAGATVGVAGVARDITARKRAEEALRVSEARFRNLVDHTPQFMWINRADGSVEFVNSEWRRYTGIDRLGPNQWDFVHPDDRKRFLDLRNGAIAAGTPYQLEMRVRRADGRWRWQFTRVVPMREEGRIVSWIGTAVDIHDIRRAQQAAEEADRSKGRFLASASHDLRQPMQSILLFAGALRAHIADEPGRAVLDRLQQGLDTLKDLLDSLLDVSRLDAGIVAPQVEEFCIADLISPLSAAFAPVAEAKGLGWQVIPCTGRVRSDRVLLGRMLRNLVDNAIRYTERGRILVDCTPHGNRLRIEVHDTGIGIAPEQQGRIFEEFHQVGNPERDRDRGLGLGLAIVRRLSHLLDHPVEMVSHPGRGSIFSVDVPLAQRMERGPDCAAAPQPVRSIPVREAANQQQRLAVVVEDDAIVMMGLATMLREWGFDVLTAGSTDQAVTRLRAVARRPDVVLADYRLRQGRVGTEAILRIRDMFDDGVPAIIITGEIGPEPQRDAAAHGIALVHKPVTPRLLEAALARHLGAVRPS
ncbi:hybrid sensor histidine kinase/response regulator [Azospirillum canadense]|uniref:hybrid sensor histidine kinase/response regulator n=1 Tax=Azospirillum canadense TaxID=403962 RepID=UPI002226C9A0|nr:PAS domain S-box protein [Azospirillum canadense]MCW2238523.1 PAS domain S-box-containing protein [Azospirillum canadense]